MTGNIILTSITKSELKEILRDCIREVDRPLPFEVDANDKPMNLKTTAEWLGVSCGTVISYKKRGILPYEQLDGSSRVRFYKSQIRQVQQKNPELLQPARK